MPPLASFPICSLFLLVSFFGLSLSAEESPRHITVQSHRGAGVLAPENSIEAFELGWALGTIPEADVRTSKDGVIVAFHDKDFARVVHHAGNDLKKLGVKDLSWTDLQALEIGAETGEVTRREKICTMADFFRRMTGRPERQLYLDIKDVTLASLAFLAQEHHVQSQVILASTKIEQIREWKSLLPEGQTLLWMGGSEEKLRARFEQLKRENFNGVTQLQIHIRPSTGADLPDKLQPSEAFIREVAAELKKRRILFQALPWGASDPDTYRHLLKLGVESFATDHPDVVMPVMREYFADAPAPKF